MLIKKEFEDIECMVCEAVEIDCNDGISFISKYDNAILILKYLFEYDDIMPYHIEIFDADWDGYDSEFIITLDDCGNVFCEKFYRNDRYLYPPDGVTFILQDCTDECREHIRNNNDRYSFFIDARFICEELTNIYSKCGCCCLYDCTDDAINDNNEDIVKFDIEFALNN